MSTTVPQLRFPEFSGEWEEKKLVELGSFKNGINKDKSDFGKGFPFVNLMDVFGKNSISKSHFGLVKATRKELKESNLVKGDVLFIRSSVKPTGVGLTAVITENLNDTVYSGFLIRFREIKKNLDLNFKKYCFYTTKFRKDLIRKSTTSANTNINQDSLKKLVINVPTISEQEKISSFLSEIDKKIEELENKLQLWQAYLKGTMQQIFTQKIRFKDENGEDYPDWESGKIGDILVQEIRKVKKPKTGYWRLGLRSHAKGTFHDFIDDPDSIAMDHLYLVKPNDLILNITFAWEHAIALADLEDENMLVSHRFPTYRFLENANPLFYKFIVIQPKFKYELGNISPGGAGRNRVMRKSEFLEIPIPIPSIKEQEKISNFLLTLENKIEQLKTEIETHKKYKNGLLQQMFC